MGKHHLKKRLEGIFGIFPMICILGGVMAACLFTGCAADNAGDEGTQQQEVSKKGFLWQKEEFAEPAALTEGNPVYIVDYQKNLAQEPDFTYDSNSVESCAFYNDKLYLLSRYYVEESHTAHYYLDTYDLNTKEKRCTELVFDIPELPRFFPVDSEIIGEGNMVFFYPGYNEEGSAIENYYAVYMNAQGELIDILDIYSALTEFGAELEPEKVFPDIVCDEEGFLYVCDIKLPRVGVIDEKGALIDTVEVTGAYDSGAVCSMKSPEGVPIFEVSSRTEEKSTLFWYDTEKPGMRILAETGYEGALSRCINQYGEIYYRYVNTIVRWNIVTGTREKIFDCKSNGIGDNGYLQRCITNAEGSLFLLDFSGNMTCLYEFSDKPAEKNNSIRIADIYWQDEYIKSCASSFSRMNPSCYIQYESVDMNADYTELQAYHDRIMAEIAAGKGPELLVVDGRDLKNLYDKGVLADLSGVLPKETEEQIFKGVLKAGTIDGMLVGLSNSVSTNTVFVSKNMWGKAAWTLEEFVDLVEEKEGELEVIFETMSYEQQPWFSVYYMALMDLENSPFIDWEKKECHFDSELFRKVLELAKRYGKTEDSNDNIGGNNSYMDYMDIQRKHKEMLDNGKAIAYPVSISNFSSFSNDMAMLGEDFINVGFPTSGEGGSYLSGYKFLVVNKAATDLDMIHEFIGYLFNEDNQRRAGTDTVRKDILSKYVVYPEWSTGAEFSMGDGSYVILECKPDGTTYLEEYLTYMDSLVSQPKGMETILGIISEEADVYFSGEKNLEQTVDVIQKRVQLYLNENK